MDKDQKRVAFQILLFVITCVTTTLAGVEWTHGKNIFYSPDFSWSDFKSGLPFSVPFLLILTVHEFGHYFTAMYHKVKATLPYYIPIPPIFLSIGTMGALIRLKSRPPSNKVNFDIGIAGPLAGFVMAMVVLVYGFTHLPPAEYIFSIHPEYEQYGLDYANHVYTESENTLNIKMGSNLLFMFFEKFVADPSRMPHQNEIMHYPFLFAGFLALVFTSINLLPIGQLDGGHVLHGLVGFRRHKQIASVIFIALLFYSGLGVVHPGMPMDELLIWIPGYIIFLYFVLHGLRWPKRDMIMTACLIFATQFVFVWQFPTVNGYTGWLLFAVVIGRFIGVEHPRAPIEVPLDRTRQILGWIALAIFVLCFSPAPIR